LTWSAACSYSETADLEPKVILMYNECIGNRNIKFLPYAECIYCNPTGYYFQGAEELTQDELSFLNNELCQEDRITKWAEPALYMETGDLKDLAEKLKGINYEAMNKEIFSQI